MKLIDKLKLMQALPPREAAIRNYIIAQPVRFVTLDKAVLLEELQISTSTLYRFSNKVSTSGFDQLRLTLAQELLMSDKVADTKIPDVNYPFKPTDSLQTVAVNLMALYKLSVDQTYKHLDFMDLAKAVQTLRQADEICLITTNTNTILAERFGNQLKEIGKKVRISSSPYKWKLETVNLSSKDALIINSYAGRSSKFFLNLLPDLHQRGVPIILMGSTRNPSFIPHAQNRLLMCDLEDPKEKLYSFSTDLSSEYLFDLLYAALYQDHYDDNIKNHHYIYD